MMTARQYAEKYAGKIVKVTSNFAKETGVDPNNPIGIVVGFKTGTMGVIGSSKVAIWDDKYEFRYGLEPKYNQNYQPVVPNHPDYHLGIYFLSVNNIELLTPPKPVVVYPNRCERCDSLCRRGKWFTICSNDRCKANKATLKALYRSPRFS